MPKKWYSPALPYRQIRALYFLKLETGKPMTWHARRAVDQYLDQFQIRYDEHAILRDRARRARHVPVVDEAE